MRLEAKRVSIESLCSTVTSGGTPSRTDPTFWDDGVVPWFKTGELNDWYLGGAEEKITADALSKSSAKIFPANTVLMAMYGDGRTITTLGLLRDEAATNQACCAMIADPKVVNFLYLFYALKYHRHELLKLVVAGAQRNLSIGIIRNFRISWFPIQVQDRIADLLSSYDELIENNRRRIALLEESVRLLYREWFVRLRFPGCEHVPMHNGLPAGWERRTALETLHVLSGGTPKTSVPEYWDGDIPFFTPKDATDGIWVTNAQRQLSQLGLDSCNSELYPKGTVFITARGTVGKLNIAQRPMAMSQSCYALRGKEYLSQPFVFAAMQAGVDALRQQAVGAVFNAIVVDTFKRINLLVPPVALVRLFDDAVSPVFEQVENLTLQNEKLRAARDLLLPRLMSGEITA